MFVIQKNKILLLSIFLFFIINVFALAVPANPKSIEVSQPDGQKVKIKLKGDENFHWAEDEDGYVVIKNTDTIRWEYASQRADGKFYTTNMIVGKDSPNEKGLKSSSINKQSLKSSNTKKKSSKKKNSLNKISTIGTLKNLVVLVQFSDLSATYTKSNFENLFNQIGYIAEDARGSVKDYYNEISYNQLDIDSVVTSWITLSHGYAYYGANDRSGNDIRPREMVSEALEKLDASGFDFSQFDSDGDGWIDGLMIIHAGRGEEWGGNDSDYIWSHEWELSSPVTYDGVKIQSYNTSPEKRGWNDKPYSQGISRIGVICHEIGHMLGLPDLYDTDYSSDGVGEFCLMAMGSWNGQYDDGASPAHMSAWCKEKLGWVIPDVITSSGTISIPRIEDNSNGLYKIQGLFSNTTEYFLIENRQGTGFDMYLPGLLRGILIWHIDNSVTTDNDDETHYMVDLEEASGAQHLQLGSNTGNDADYFRLGNKTVFLSTTTPNSNSYSGEVLGKNILSISATNSTMTFVVREQILNISGYIQNNSSQAVSGITINMTGTSTGTATTNSTGYYKFSSLLLGGNYTLTPDSTAYIFNPTSITKNSLLDNEVSQDFWALVEIISVDVSELYFGSVEKGKSKTLAINITNAGLGTLSGTITSNVSWAQISNTNFSGNSVSVDITVDMESFDKDGRYTGTLTISSNGGTATIILTVQATCVITKPNPYNPRIDGDLKFYGSGIVANDTEIQIMTINGEHVKTIKETQGLNEISWDGKNEAGREVVNGTYLYASRSPREKWLWKFTVLKR